MARGDRHLVMVGRKANHRTLKEPVNRQLARMDIMIALRWSSKRLELCQPAAGGDGRQDPAATAAGVQGGSANPARSAVSSEVTDLYERLLAAHCRESEAHAARADSERQRADHVASLAVTLITSQGDISQCAPALLKQLQQMSPGENLSSELSEGSHQHAVVCLALSARKEEAALEIQKQKHLAAVTDKEMELQRLQGGLQEREVELKELHDRLQQHLALLVTRDPAAVQQVPTPIRKLQAMQL
eukprot:gene6249-6485_t